MNYYNEFDPFAAAWLRELIKTGLIPAGDVDERSIEDVRPADIDGYTQCHFFAGIGGWSRALALAGWPADRPVWTGSCPCQPFSAAGARKGTDDERHLWPAFRWLVDQCRPPVVFGEQVASKAGRAWFAGVQTDLEAMGYGAAAADLCAAGVGAPHIRQRVWWVGHADQQGSQGRRVGRKGPDQRVTGTASVDGGLADSTSKRRDGGETPAGPSRRNVSKNGGASGGLADSTSKRRDGGETPAGTAGWSIVEDDGDRRLWGVGVQRLDDPAGPRCHGPQQGAEGETWGEARLRLSGEGGRDGSVGFWDAFDILPCNDGKARRVEPGTFPLAHGIPARVGRLRGYGNAIVPQVAATFIEAYLETATPVDSIE